MGRTRIAIIGFGNVGRGAAEAIAASSDFELAGVVRRHAGVGERLSGSTWEAPAVTDIARLGPVAGAIVCIPTREVERIEHDLLRSGISVVDSYDLHGKPLWKHRESLQPSAIEGRAVAVVSAGWDPGSDSIIRALAEALAPSGITYTNFGPGMSMGHSVAVRAIPGVRDAISITLPAGYGRHRRAVYVAPDGTRPAEEITSAIMADPYFVNDETDVTIVDSTAGLADTGHGVTIDRKGACGVTANQMIRWEMRITNPALTGQVMLAALRAGLKRDPGVYTMIELPSADMLPGTLESKVVRLV